MTTLETENHLGFDFVRFGRAFLCEEGMLIPGTDRHWHAALEPIHEDFLDAEQSVYLVKKGEDIVYIGEYTDTFKNRWLNRGRYFWHSDNVDDKINRAIRNGEEVSFWLSVDPYLGTETGPRINISHSLEYELIKAYQPVWNTVHKGDNLSRKRKRVTDILASLASAPATA